MFFRVSWGLGLGAAFLAAVTMAGQASAKGKVTWTQVGNDSGHTGYASDAGGLNSKSAAKLANVGSYNSNGPVVYQPVIFDGLIYFRSGDGNFYADDLATKQVVWSIPNYQSPFSGWGLAVSKAAVVTNCVLGDNVSGLCGYNPKTGKQLWTYGLTSGGGFTPPAIDGDSVYFLTSGAEDNGGVNAPHLVSLNVKNGKERWRQWYCDDFPTCESFSGTPAVANGIIYVGCAGAARYPVVTIVGLCAFNENGQLVWEHALGNDGNGNGTDGAGLVTAVGNSVYVSYKTNCNQCNYNLDVMELNGTTGTAVWDTVVGGPYNGESNALGAPVIGPDSTVDETVGGQNQFVTALKANGSQLWSVDTSQNHLYTTPTLAGKTKGKKSGALFFTCGAQNQGTTCAFDASNGALLWQSTDINVQRAFSPIVAEGAVYNTCGFNNVCIYQPQ